MIHLLANKRQPEAPVQHKNMQMGGYLFLLAGCAFIGAFYFSRQAAFIGVSAAFFGVGASFVAKGRHSSRQD